MATMCMDTTMTNRGLRFEENIAQYNKVTWDDFLKIKYDSHYPKRIAFLRKYDINDIYDLKETEHLEIAEGIRIINTWNKTGFMTDTNAAFVYKVMYELYNHSGGETENKLVTDKKAKFELYVSSIKMCRMKCERILVS